MPLVASQLLPAIVISMPCDHEVCVIIPGSTHKTWALAHQLVAEIYLASIGPSARQHPMAHVKAGGHALCLQITTSTLRHVDALALVQRLEGAISKYARDDAGMATHRTIVTPWSPG